MPTQRILNWEIKVPTVRVRVHNGPLLGVMSIEEALGKAQELDLDLLLRGNPTDEAPLCEIRDMSQILYNEAISAEMKRLQPNRLKPKVGEISPAANNVLLMNIAPENLIKRWGESRHRLTYNLLEQLDIPINSKQYLSKVGLPDSSSWSHDFEFDFSVDNFVNLAELVKEGRQADEFAYTLTIQQLGRIPSSLKRIYYYPAPINFSQYWRLGDNQIETICIQEGSGAIVIVDVRGFGGEYFPLRFVNTSVELLGQFIYLCQEVQAKKAKSRSIEIKNLRKRFRKMDPKAMEDTGSGFWPTTLEELLYEAEDE